MKKRIIAALAAIGLVAAMTGFGSIPAAAEETGDETVTTSTRGDRPGGRRGHAARRGDHPSGRRDGTTRRGGSAGPQTPSSRRPPEGPAPPAETEESTEEESSEEGASAARVSSFSTESFEIQAAGIAGTPYPWTNDTNHAWYWEAWLEENGHHEAQCYEHDRDKASNSHGYLLDSKTVVLNAYGNDWPGDHWELLVVKAGSEFNLVTVDPNSGLPGYSAYDNKDISHYIVCKGDTPDEPTYASADVQTNPGTCTSAGTVTGINPVNANFAAPTYPGGNTYQIVATAIAPATFPNPGSGGVSADGTTKTLPVRSIRSWVMRPVSPQRVSTRSQAHVRPPALSRQAPRRTRRSPRRATWATSTRSSRRQLGRALPEPGTRRCLA